jgi:hypothetical protein
MRSLERRLEKLENMAGAGVDWPHFVFLIIHESDDESAVELKQRQAIEQYWREHPELDPVSTRIEFIRVVLVAPKEPGTQHEADDG